MYIPVTCLLVLSTFVYIKVWVNNMFFNLNTFPIMLDVKKVLCTKDNKVVKI